MRLTSYLVFTMLSLLLADIANAYNYKVVLNNKTSKPIPLPAFCIYRSDTPDISANSTHSCYSAYTLPAQSQKAITVQGSNLTVGLGLSGQYISVTRNPNNGYICKPAKWNSSNPVEIFCLSSSNCKVGQS